MNRPFLFPRGKAVTAAAAVSMVLALSACGGASDEDNNSDAASSIFSTTETTTASSSAEKTTEDETTAQDIPSEEASAVSPAEEQPAESAPPAEANPAGGQPAAPRPADLPQDVPYPDYVQGLAAAPSATGYTMTSNSASRGDADRLVGDLKGAGFIMDSDLSSNGSYVAVLKRDAVTVQVVFEGTSNGFVYDVVGLRG